MKKYDVIIIGGSISGLSAAMTLGRSLRNVLVIDSGKPCNRFTPHSHNFLTQDGSTPAEIIKIAKEQISKYETVEFLNGEVLNVTTQNETFTIELEKKKFHSRRIILATGLKDNLPEIKGLKECWGISAIHCPYCHGYEFRNQKTGILTNGEAAFHYAKLVSNLTSDLKIFTNGKPEFTNEQLEYLRQNKISIIDDQLIELKHENGYLKEILFENHASISIDALYVRPQSEQSFIIPEKLGCEINSNGLLIVDIFQKTNVKGIYACGDNSNMFRSVSAAVASGNMAGASVNMELQN